MDKPINYFLPPGFTDRDIEEAIHDGSDPADVTEAAVEAHRGMLEKALEVALVNRKQGKA